jgi:hypothetical protein
MHPVVEDFVIVADEKSTPPSWKVVKQALESFDRAGLLGLVQDLYAANKDNKAFLHARLEHDFVGLNRLGIPKSAGF